MELRYSTFIMPHIGDKYSQCADRFAIGVEKNCFAIADGVGESLFPYDWAELVCDDFITNPSLFCADNKLIRENRLIEAWEKKRDERISNLTETELFLYEMGLEKADFAACTFVGLCIDNSQWQCSALGDSYLFVLDKEFEIIDSVASQKGEEFSNFPEYFASKLGKNHGEVVESRGDIDKVAYFVLLTDAISDWFLQVDKERRKELLAIQEMQSFHSLVNRERELGNMKDDDTTAVIIEVVKDDTEYLKFIEVYNSNIYALISDEEKCAFNEKEEKDNQNGSNIDELRSTVNIKDYDTGSIEIKKINENDVIEEIKVSFFEEISLKIDNLKKEIDILLSEIKLYESENNKNNKKTCNFLKRNLQNIIDIVNEILKKINQYK